MKKERLRHDQPFTVNYRDAQMEFVYIDDLVESMMDLFEGKENHCEHPGVGETADGVMYDGLTPMEEADGRYAMSPPATK